MTTQNTLNTGIPAILMLVQRIDEDFGTHVTFENGDIDVTKSAQAVVDDARTLLEDLNKAVEAIALDENLSMAGAQKKAIELVAQAYGKLAIVGKAAQTRKAAADDARSKLLEVAKPQGDALVAFFEEYEVRQRLAALSEPDRMMLFAQSIADRNPVIERAVMRDPLKATWMPTEFVERVRRENAEATKTQEWQRLKSLEYVAERLAVLTTTVNLNLQNYGTTPTYPKPQVPHADFKMQDTQKGPGKSASADKPVAGVGALT